MASELAACWIVNFLLVSFIGLGRVVGEDGAVTSPFANVRFSTEPSDMVAVRGQPAMLNCAVRLGGASTRLLDVPQIQWLRDSVALNFDTNDRWQRLSNGSLYVTSIEFSRRDRRPDEGSYQCVAVVRSLGKVVSRKARLQVAYMENSFDEEPQDQTAYLRDTAMFACDMGGAPTPSVRWYKDEVELDVSDGNYVIHGGGTVLEIRGVQFSDLGRYKCRVENVDKSRVSKSAMLLQNADTATYLGQSPVFVMRPRSETVVEGGTVTFYCAANGRDRNEQLPKLSWLKDGVTLDTSGGGRLSVRGQGSLYISNVTEADAGSYICRATNLEDSVDAEATLIVHVPPRIIKAPQNVAASEKAEAVFECGVYGVPAPSVIWMKNGDRLIPTEYFQISGDNSLRILGLVKQDDGFYQCLAENRAGNVQATAQLVVAEQVSVPSPSVSLTTPKPTLTAAGSVSTGVKGTPPSAPQDVKAVLVSTRFVTLAWRVPAHSGSSDVTSYAVFWKEIGSQRERVLNTSSLEANVQYLKPSTKYEFRVVAHNQAGVSPQAATITVELQPEVNVPTPPQNLKVVAISTTSLKASWSVPENAYGELTGYKIYYYGTAASTVDDEERELSVVAGSTEATLLGLRKYHEYSVRVAAVNSNGIGISTDEVTARTYSDLPVKAPENVTVEATSSTTLVVRWLPPPEDSQNGIITGYKIRYKKQNARGSELVTTDSSDRAYTLSDLEKNSVYHIRMMAQNVNGSGPATSWIIATTFANDLIETKTPGKPRNLQVRAMSSSVIVSWFPPEDTQVMVRGFVLSYGIGAPYDHRQVLDYKQSSYVIKDLRESSEYVLSVAAFNNAGEGPAMYDTVTTREEPTEHAAPALLPPVGLKAIVLSSTTVQLTWTDTTLGRNQRITDNRVYTVRYGIKTMKKPKTVETTEVNLHVEHLSPNTEYEFAVRVTKGHRQSAYSMAVSNTTQEAAPSTPPRDLTLIPLEGHPTMVTLSWQPPRFPNGQLTGYFIYYTADNSQDDANWAKESLKEDRMNVLIRDLSPDTTYYFKAQARNSKGYSPMSGAQPYRTPPRGAGLGGKRVDSSGERGMHSGEDYPASSKPSDSLVPGSLLPPLVLWIIIGVLCGLTVIGIVVAVVVLYYCRNNTHNNAMHANGNGRMNYKATPLKGGGGSMPKLGPKDLHPPDLWIDTGRCHQMEMKHLDDGDDGAHSERTHLRSTGSPDGSMGGRHDFYEDKFTQQIPSSRSQYMLDRALLARDVYGNGRAMDSSSSSGIVVPQPLRPLYSRAHSTSTHSSTPRINDLVSSTHQPHEVIGTATLERHRARSQRLCHHTGSTGRLASLSVRPQMPPLQLHPPTFRVGPPMAATSLGAGMPPFVARPLLTKSPPDVVAMRGTGGGVSALHTPSTTVSGTSDDPDLQKSFSHEELSVEMANLEGLMKDLTAITQTPEFEC